MRTKNFLLIVYVSVIMALGIAMGMVYSEDKSLFARLAIAPEDVPQGFVFGKIPNFAKKVFTGNPCVVNPDGIRFLASKLYPDGNSANIKSMYVAIMAAEARPYGDDLVYYVLVFKDSKAATVEIKKLQDYYQFNKDRIVLITKDTIALLLFADDVDNYKYIAQLGEKLQARLN
ncbi:MAG: hypothetical protein N3F66_08410 [Spirochaetes bacterium]|nr:hypothetical protein [Spirochaetota bacterium]